MADTDAKMKSETERRGFPVNRFSNETVTAMTHTLGVGTDRKGSSGSKRHLAALAEALADGTRWDAWLAELPAACLLVLEVLVEAGGGTDCESLDALLQQRGVPSEEEAADAMHALLERRLIVPLGRSGESGFFAVSIYHEAFGPLEERVRGVSLPALPEALTGDTSSPPAESPLRRRLAVASLTAHRRLRFTLKGAANRSNLRRFARELGPPTEEIGRLVDQAAADGLLGARDERFVVQASQLFDAIQKDEPLGPFAEWLRPGHWVSLEALARAALGANLEAGRRNLATYPDLPLAYHLSTHLGQIRNALVTTSGIECLEIGEQTWLRARQAVPEPNGDGHVTPSFEVILGPAADLAIVATIGLGCELQRVDRMLTFRLTKESVAAGITAGLEKGQLHAALDVVGRHAVPDNVAHLVAEWERGTRVAAIEEGWFLFADRESQAALERGPLAPWLLGSPAPGVLRLARKTPRETLMNALAEHGLEASLRYPMEQATIQCEFESLDPNIDSFGDFDNPFEEPEPEEENPVGDPPWPLEPTGAPELRERIEQARATGFAPALDSPGDDAGSPGAELGRLAIAGDRAAPGGGDMNDELVQQLVGCLDRLKREAARELAHFRRRLPEHERLSFEIVLELGAPLAGFLALKPKWRRRVANEANDLPELMDLAHEHCERNRMSRVGGQMLALLADPDVVAGFEAAAERGDPILEEMSNLERAIDVVFDGDDPTEVHPPEERPEPSTAASITRRVPPTESFPETQSFDLMAALARATEQRRPVFLLRKQDPGKRKKRGRGRAAKPRVLHVYIDHIVLRAGRQVLLTSDYHTNETLACPVQEIQSLVEERWG